MNEKINCREKVPCFGNEPSADIKLLHRTAEADRKRKELLGHLKEDCKRVERMVFIICVFAICASLVAIGYLLHSAIEQIIK